MRKINILFAIPNFITAGSGREMFNIIERLDKSIFNPIVAVQQEGGALYNEIQEKGYQLITAAFISDKPNAAMGIFQAMKNAVFFKHLNIDIWQSFNWSSDYTEAITARCVGSKYVYVKKNMNWNRKAWKLKSMLSHAIVARNTSLLKHIFAPQLFKRKTHFITGGVDIQKFKPHHTERKVDVDKPFTVCCIAQLIRLKGQDTLIKAVAEIDNVTLLLAGSTRDIQYKKELEDLIHTLKLEERIKIIEYTPSHELLNNIDAFVLPTTRLLGHEEGCPVALLEAMANGLPCIASNVAGNIDLIQHNETGLLFKVNDHKDLAVQIGEIKNDGQLRNRLGSAARKKVVSEHTLEMEATAFSQLYLKMAGRL